MHRETWAVSRRDFIRTAVVLVPFAGLAVSASAAQPSAAKVLVINSDASVEKYNVAQQSFIETIGMPVKELNLAGLSDSAAERAVRAEVPTALYCIGSRAFLTAGKAAKGKPTVLSSTINWQRLPAAASAHVIATEVASESQLTMFSYFFPKVKRIGVLYSAEFNRQWMADAMAAARDVGVEVIGVPVRTTSGARRELGGLLSRVDALWVTADPVVLADVAAVRTLFTACAAAKKPVFTYSTAFSEFDPTLIVAPDIPTIGRQAASLLQGLVPGAKREVQSPAGSEVTLNLRAVKEYGLVLNNEALDSVNHVIR